MHSRRFRFGVFLVAVSLLGEVCTYETPQD
jgi:hypothetical protein